VIVHAREVTESRGEVTVTARVEVERPGPACPDTLWFAFPGHLARFVTDNADGFAAGLLPLAMLRREPLRLRGDLSYRLAHGLREYQRYQSAWKPDVFAPVEVRSDSLARRGADGGVTSVGTAFSGGVDSFHTLWTHLGDNEPLAPSRITHGLMINGFDADLDLADSGSFARLQRLYEPRLRRVGVELVVVRTNLLQFLGIDLQKQCFAANVTAPALVLGQLFSRYYVPSSYHFSLLNRFYDGSHPMFDHFLSTETMDTVHDGGHLGRVEKTLEIARWPETYELLRVCFRATGVQASRDAVANCCACEKCLRTMATLDIAGRLEDYACFPEPLRRSRLRRIDYALPGARVFADEIVAFARREGRHDIARSLRWSILHSRLYRHRVRGLMLASYALEQRAPRYAAVARPLKRLIQRTGLGRGWLY